MTGNKLLQDAERSGVTMSKDALLKLLRNSIRKQYPMVKHAQGAVILIPVTKDGKARG